MTVECRSYGVSSCAYISFCWRRAMNSGVGWSPFRLRLTTVVVQGFCIELIDIYDALGS